MRKRQEFALPEIRLNSVGEVVLSWATGGPKALDEYYQRLSHECPNLGLIPFTVESIFELADKRSKAYSAAEIARYSSLLTILSLNDHLLTEVLELIAELRMKTRRSRPKPRSSATRGKVRRKKPRKTRRS